MLALLMTLSGGVLAQYRSGPGSGFAEQRLSLVPNALPEKDSIELFPLPAKSWQQLKLHSPLNLTKVQIFNAQGQLVAEVGTWVECQTSPGIYWLKLFFGQQLIVVKKVAIL
jgi:hypothetical protein